LLRIYKVKKMSLVLDAGGQPLKIPEIEPREVPEQEASDEEKARVVPDPSGWRILCAVPEIKNTFEGSQILKADSLIRIEEQTTVVLAVIKVGPEAYRDKDKFPSGPWCKPGDFVMVRAYAGTRFRVYGREFRLLNDDQIDAVVQDPRGVHRV